MAQALGAITTADRRRSQARADALDRPSPVAGASPRAAFAEADAPDAEADDRPPATRLARALAERRFVISVEIDPPRSIRIDRTLEAARLLRDAGTDVVNISDSAMARVRMGAMAVAFGVQHDVGVECVVHTTTRDRNLMALESELLGAHALGVRNILALTGDPPRVGDYPTGTGVWDVDSIGLIEILTRLNRGEDQAGSPIGHRAVVHHRVRPRPHRPRRRDRVGPPGAQARRRGPPGHDPAAVRRAAGRGDARRGTATLRPARVPGPGAARRAAARVSSRHAEFLHNEVPGITIPDAARARMADAGAAGTEAGIEMADALLAAVEHEVAGHVPHAQLRALRAGRRARPADPRAPSRHHGRRARVAFRHAHRPPGARRRRRGPGPPARRSSSAAGPPFPDPVEDQAVYDTAGVLRCRDHRQGRGRDRQDRGRHRRRGRRLHAARARWRQHRRGRGSTPSR